jgi:cbb3-type cytochrome oxidase subunit 3
MEKKENGTFSYTYSAKQQEEIRSIQKKYTTPEEDKMEQLRKLDKNVTEKAVMAALIVGVIGALVLGSGMSLVMTELNVILGLSQTVSMIIGTVIGLVGMVLVSLAYPLYNRTLKKERDKAAPEIMRLADELLKM